jgi:hypothetical protein
MTVSAPFLTIFVHFIFIILLFSEDDEILKICNVIDSPDKKTWPGGLTLAGTMKYRLPQVNVYPFFVFAVILLVSNSCVSSTTNTSYLKSIFL